MGAGGEVLQKGCRGASAAIGEEGARIHSVAGRRRGGAAGIGGVEPRGGGTLKWYHWIFVMIFLIFNVSGWHSNFWISLIPLALLLLIGAKLEHIINKLAYEVATKHFAADEEGLEPFGRAVLSPRVVLSIIHFILFQNAYFFWTLAMFGVNSCMMDGPGYSISRIIICVVVEVLCSYSTIPLYGIVTHMGSSFKSAVFADDVAEHIRGWADGARRRNRVAAAAAGGACSLGAAAATEPSEELTSCGVTDDWSQPAGLVVEMDFSLALYM
uniref:MLO-like protein n=1 Tax=Setaria viridis TaxID=4556 RepID=A0A4U6TPE2_SETVI|nr:LOW QUALITY PROTEIN: hypothetical protein SEVIR_7G118800v2 [Setaria viridis]